MTVNLPEKAGFMPTPEEWAQLVRIAENLAAQVVQRDAALRQMQADRDAARAEVARLTAALEAVTRLLKQYVSDYLVVTGNYVLTPQDMDDLFDALRQPAPAGGEARE